ncbi:MAG: LysM peptidoglycan-binding domain-containing protein [Pelolinea sp.]|nr:LysM peptidoglycan-binding domain-containing protein [Pelolinea sp.]
MKKINLVGLLVVFLAGCQIVQPVDESAMSKLTPYITKENTTAPLENSTPEPEIESSAAPTAAPVIHVVALGETISSIALQYGVTIDAVRGANPDANPNVLIVGDELEIPLTDINTISAFDPEIARNVRFSGLNCVHSRDAGIWCLVLVENLGENDLENIVVAFSFLDPDGKLIEERYAPAVMRFAPAGSSTPVVIFLKTVPLNFINAAPSLFSVQVVDTAANLYLPIVVEEETRFLNGIEATISGKIRVESDKDVDRADIWIGAAAFDADGALVGVRRLDSVAATNEPFNFALTVYAAESSIARVVLYAEAY